MSTTKADFGHGQTVPHQAREWSPADMHFPADGPFAFCASNSLAERFGKRPFQGIGFGETYSTLDWTATTTGTSAAAAANVGGGVLLTCGSDSTFNTNLQSKNSWTPVVNKWVNFAVLLQQSDITTVGFDVGMGTSAVDPSTSNYTSQFGFKVIVGGGLVIGKVRGTSGTAASSATLATLAAATDLLMVGRFNLGIQKTDHTYAAGTGASSTNQAVTSTVGMQVGDVLYWATTAAYRVITAIVDATNVTVATISTTTAEVITVFTPQGAFWTGTDINAMTKTELTSAQLVQLGKIMETPAAMYFNLSAKGSAATPTVLVQAACAQVDR